MFQSCRFQKDLRSLHAEIVSSRGQIGIIAGELNAGAATMSHFDLIAERKRHHERLQFVKTIVAFPKDAERKIDLGRSGE